MLEPGDAGILTWEDIQQRFADRRAQRSAAQRVSLCVEFHDLVDRFLGSVHTTVVRVSQWPDTGPPVLRDDHDEIIERTVPADGFPYAIRYRILGDRLLVMAVLHQSRHPNLGVDRQPCRLRGDEQRPRRTSLFSSNHRATLCTAPTTP